jgi:hypothetical protein
MGVAVDPSAAHPLPAVITCMKSGREADYRAGCSG